MTNLLERLNEAIKRRTHVVRTFPDAESWLVIRASTVAMRERRLGAHRYFHIDHRRTHKNETLRMAA